MLAFAEQKLKKDEGLGVIRRLGPTARPDNVNRISLAPKNSETEPWRLVGDIRRPNRSYGKKKVRFETLRHVSEVFEPHDWLWLADLKAAYHSIFVQERLARQLITTSTLPASNGPPALVSELGEQTSAWTIDDPESFGSDAAADASRTTDVVG